MGMVERLKSALLRVMMASTRNLLAYWYRQAPSKSDHDDSSALSMS